MSKKKSQTPIVKLEFGIWNFNPEAIGIGIFIYPTRLIIFPGTIITLFGVLPSN
ncbi:hypothetical protein SAMN04487979_117100 [Flavobacterium sp. ov086]|nr:hypothetical protein SAMN04487979_117100 [Flavobacterium sp. ov086]